MSGEEIAKCSEYKFKKLVDERIKQKAAEHLTNLQMKHSKSKFLYQEEKIKEYLISEELSTNEKKWLFKMRVRMCPNKTNFEGMYKPDLSCSLCLDKTKKETELHLLNCDFFPAVSRIVCRDEEYRIRGYFQRYGQADQSS